MAEAATPSSFSSNSWSDIHESLLETILTWPTMNSFDLLNCGEVCLSWGSVVNRIYTKSPSLLLSSSLFFPNKRHTTTQFYKISLPITHLGRNYMYSSRGWLLSAAVNESDDLTHRDLQLFNPSSQATIHLPWPPSSFCKSPFKFILSTSPKNPDCTIILLDGNLTRMVFCKPNSKRHKYWSRLCGYMQNPCEDNIFYRDRFLGINDNGGITNFKLSSRELGFHLSDAGSGSRTRPGPKICSRYLVESSLSGDLLMVTRSMEWGNDFTDYKTVDFKVYRLVEENWVKVRSLGDQALFLVHNDSRCVSACDDGAFKPNCIYFVDDSMEGYYPSSGTDFGVFEMEKKIIHRFHGIPCNRWFKPSDF